MTKAAHPPLTIRTGAQEPTPVNEIQIPDLWHLANAIPKLTDAIDRARERLAADDPAEADLALAEVDHMHGNTARDDVLEVWHMAHAQERALSLAQEKLHAILDSPEIGPITRKLVTEALGGDVQVKFTARNSRFLREAKRTWDKPIYKQVFHLYNLDRSAALRTVLAHYNAGALPERTEFWRGLIAIDQTGEESVSKKTEERHVNRDCQGKPLIPVSVHWKQGDDFGRHLEEADSVPAAVRSWAVELRGSADELDKLAAVLDEAGEDLHACGDVHCVEIGGVSEELAVAALEQCGKVVPKSVWGEEQEEA